MPSIESYGIVIKTQDYKENDKLVWLFTENMGKITAIAKGAKKSKNKLFSLTMPFTLGQYMLFQGKNLYSLSEGRIINSFQELLKDFDKLTYASYICELIDISQIEKESNQPLFKDFATAMYLLNTKALDDELLIRAFEMKLLNHTGYGLNLSNCAHCGKSISASNYISTNYFTGICDSCPKENYLYISKPAYSTLRFMSQSPLDKIYKLTISKEVKQEINKLLSYIIAANYARKPKSLELLNIFKE